MKLRWGLCGVGRITNDFCYALKTLPKLDHEVLAVGSKSKERAQQFAEKMSIQKAYGSYEELAQDPDIDIVYIGTIQSTHLPLSKLMLNAGKHVLCEKPMCLNTDQVKEIFQLSKEKHKFFVEGVWSRSFEIYQRIKEEIQSGAIGDIQLVTASICLPLEATLKSFDKGDGCLHSIGLYTVQFANWICDNEMPKSIYAVGSLNDAGCDVDGCVTLTYESGTKASLSYTSKCYGVNAATVYGSEGCIHIPDFFYSPVEVSLPSGKVSLPLTPVDPSVYNHPNAMGLRFQAETARQSILRGETESPVMGYKPDYVQNNGGNPSSDRCKI